MKATKYTPPIPEATYVVKLSTPEVYALINEFLSLGKSVQEIRENYPHIYELWSSIGRADQIVGVVNEPRDFKG